MTDTNSKDDKNMLLSNKYRISLNFLDAGMIINDTDNETGAVGQRQILYNEVSNYFNSNFPARILSVTMKAHEINKLLSSRSRVDSSRELFDVEVNLVSVVSDNCNQLLPLDVGKFKAVLKESDSIYNFITMDNVSNISEQNMNTNTNVNFFLFRENELDFGLNANINFLYTNANIMSIFTHGMIKSNPGLKYIISEFDHNPVVPKLLVPRMGFNDFIELMEDEFGFYRSKHSLFVENGIMYFLNKEENPKVTVAEKEYRIELDVIRYASGESNEKSYMNNLSTDRLLKVRVRDHDIKINVNNTNVMVNDPIYISPKGNMSFNVNSSSRKVDTIRKITEIPHLASYKNLQYEYIDVSLTDVALINVNPLTKITYMDSNGILREYRICFKSTSVKSRIETKSMIRGFRILKKV